MQTQKNSFLSSDLEILAGKLEGKRVGIGYQCKCPCHEDKKNSLSLNESSAVGILFRCHAGCTQDEVGTALKALLGIKPEEKIVKLNAPNRRKSAVATYPYYRELNNLAYEKLRYEPKYFNFRHQVNGEWVYSKPKDVEAILYFQVKFKRLQGKALVIIAEGEKDCDNLNKLLGDTAVAVTNDNGAAGWTKAHQDILGDSEFIICEHLDEAGRRRSTKIASLALPGKLLGVVRFKQGEVPDKGDVSDWLAKGHTVEELVERLKNIEPVDNVAVGSAEEKKKKQIAKYDDYRELFVNYKPRYGRDIFTGKTMYEDFDGIWKPIENKLGVIKSLARDLTQDSDKNYHASAVPDHFDKFTDELACKFLINIPEWNQQDNIGKLCSYIRLNLESNVTELCFMALVKEWMANLFRKLEDPTMDTSPSREFILILTGKEKIGKDYWIRSLLCGLGQFFSPMSVGNNERDNLMQLHSGLVLNISEFDRTSKLETSFIKDIVTRSSTNLRASYARDSEIRFSRTNFIASANMSDLLRDHGENTRYAIFEIQGINREYKKDLAFSLQCLAQAKHLAESGFVAPLDLWHEMGGFIKDQTPEDPNTEIAEIYEEAAKKWLNQLFVTDREAAVEISDKGWVKSSLLNDVFIEVAKKTYGSIRRVKSALVALKYRKRTNEDRGFYITKL